MITKETTNCPKKRPVYSRMLKEATEADLFKNGKATTEDGKIVDELGLTELVIPDGVTDIGQLAFGGCDSLKSVTIPDSVTSIGDYAFHDCRGLTNVTIGNGVTSIGQLAFGGCWRLREVSIPDSVTSIGVQAFSNCNGLASVSIPDSVTSIGEQAFWFCKGLTNVTIGNDVTSIGRLAFGYCFNLKKLIFQGKTMEEIYNMDDYPWGLDEQEQVIIPGKESSNGTLEESLISKWRKLYLKSI